VCRSVCGEVEQIGRPTGSSSLVCGSPGDDHARGLVGKLLAHFGLGVYERKRIDEKPLYFNPHIVAISNYLQNYKISALEKIE
jgi:hypothetical protein